MKDALNILNKKNIIQVKYNYNPLQPGMEQQLENYVEKKLNINDALHKSISLFYQFKVNKDSKNSMYVLPDGCIEVLFCCNRKMPSASIYGSVIKSRMIPLSNDCEYFGARILPGKSSEFFKYSVKQLTENEIPLLDLTKKDPFIIEKITRADNFRRRVHIFEEFITSLYLEFDCTTKMVQYSIKKICETKGKLSINNLSEYTGYSTRYIRKVFENYVGIPPKLLSQIIRFQNSLNMIIKNEHYDLINIILDCGYYDQAHFINEFKKFTAFTPGQIKLKNF